MNQVFPVLSRLLIAGLTFGCLVAATGCATHDESALAGKSFLMLSCSPQILKTHTSEVGMNIAIIEYPQEFPVEVRADAAYLLGDEIVVVAARTRARARRRAVGQVTDDLMAQPPFGDPPQLAGHQVGGAWVTTSVLSPTITIFRWTLMSLRGVVAT